MHRLTTIAASALAVAALVPATAAADHNELRSHPQMFQVDAVEDLGATRKVRANGRHGYDFKYTARVNVDDALEVGRKYRVTFRLSGHSAGTFQVRLRAAR